MHLEMSFDESQFRTVRTRIVDDTEKIAERAVEKATRDALQKAKEGRFKDRTGTLRKEIFHEIEGWNNGYYWGLVISPTKYAKFVEYPTRPHEIHPKAAYGAVGPLRQSQTRRAKGPGPHEHIVGRGYALRWKDEGGVEHFARSVHHPGTEGQKFMWAASVVALTTLRLAIREGFVTIAMVH